MLTFIINCLFKITVLQLCVYLYTYRVNRSVRKKQEESRKTFKENNYFYLTINNLKEALIIQNFAQGLISFMILVSRLEHGHFRMITDFLSS